MKMKFELSARVPREAVLFEEIFKDLRFWDSVPKSEEEFLETLREERQDGQNHSVEIEVPLEGEGHWVRYITGSKTTILIYFGDWRGMEYLPGWSSAIITIPAERVGGNWHSHISEMAREIDPEWDAQWLAPPALWWAWVHASRHGSRLRREKLIRASSGVSWKELM